MPLPEGFENYYGILGVPSGADSVKREYNTTHPETRRTALQPARLCHPPHISPFPLPEPSC